MCRLVHILLLSSVLEQVSQHLSFEKQRSKQKCHHASQGMVLAFEYTRVALAMQVPNDKGTSARTLAKD